MFKKFKIIIFINFSKMLENRDVEIVYNENIRKYMKKS